MSKTQQEIATPKDCKNYSTVICGVIYALCVVLIALAIILAADNPVYISAAVIVATAIAACTTFAVFRRRFFVVIGTVFALIMVICADLVWYFMTTMTASNRTAKISCAFLSEAVCLILIALITVLVLLPKNQKRHIVTTKYITYTASFAALSIVCKMISNTISTVLPIVSIKLSIVYIPWTISGIVLGPIGGVFSAFLGDLIGQVLIPTGGSVLPLTLLSNSLFPLFPALAYRYLPIKNGYIKVIIGLVISMLCCTFGIGTYSLYQAYYSDSKFTAYFITRLWQLPVLVLNAVLIISLLPPLKRLGLTELFVKKNGQATT